MRDNRTSYRLEAEGAVGYLKMTRFNGQTEQHVLEAVQALQRLAGEKIRGYVLDLRANTGGLLDQAILLADAFLDRGTIAIMKGRNLQETGRHEAKPGDILNGKKLVVIIDAVTATGPEIVAGALQDNRRATVVGVHSKGMASIQTVYPMRDKSAVKLTTARFYTPRGQSIQGKGIQPNVKVENTSQDKNSDPQLKKAIELITAN